MASTVPTLSGPQLGQCFPSANLACKVPGSWLEALDTSAKLCQWEGQRPKIFLRRMIESVAWEKGTQSNMCVCGKSREVYRLDIPSFTLQTLAVFSPLWPTREVSNYFLWPQDLWQLYLFIYLFICLFIYLFIIYQSIYLFTYLSIHSFIYFNFLK